VWFVDTATSAVEALHRSVEFAGPDNYSPVLVGAVAGARRGARALSPLNHVTSPRSIEELCTGLAVDWL
jgi:hypothetical protein